MEYLRRLTGRAGMQPAHRPHISVIRGAALNPFEMQAYVPLQEYFDLKLIGQRNGSYQSDLIGLPTVLLPSVSAYRSARTAWRLGERVTGQSLLDSESLWGLGFAVRRSHIVHSAETFIPLSEQAARICSSSTKHLVLTCWETIPFRSDEDPRIRQRKELVKRACSLFIAVTPRARDALIEEGVDSTRIEVVPAAVDCKRFNPRNSGDEGRAMLKVTQDQIVALYIGRLIQEKGIVEMIRAFARASDQRCVLAIVGSGNQAERAMYAARGLGIADRIRILPNQSYSDTPKIYAAADLVIAPSLPTPYWEEQFGMVLIEAMASGKALVTTDSGAIPQVVKDAALLATPYDQESLTSHIRHLLGDADARRDLGNRAREFASTTYGIEVIAPRLADCYRKVMDVRDA